MHDLLYYAGGRYTYKWKTSADYWLIEISCDLISTARRVI